MHYHGEERVYTGEPDEEVCNCIAVLREEIQEAVDLGAKTVAKVGDECGAGGGCGECHPEIARLLAEHRLGGPVAAAGRDACTLVAEVLRPLAQSIGAEVTIGELDEWELLLRVRGDEEQKQTVALWAELFVEPAMPEGAFVEVESDEE